MGHTQQLPASERQCANIRIALDLDPASTSEALIETTRGLLLGRPIGNGAVIAVAWCVGIALAGYGGARLYSTALGRRN
jgi:hypothetical protein